MTDTITLPRVVIEQAIDALTDLNNGLVVYNGEWRTRQHVATSRLRAALAQQAKQGWVRVPVEPTQLMLRALIKEWDSVGGKTMYENYKTMLAAAPKGGV